MDGETLGFAGRVLLAGVLGGLIGLERVEASRVSIRDRGEGRVIEAHLEPEPGVARDAALAELSDHPG